MSKRLDWESANRNERPVYTPSVQERRLDRRAEGWLEAVATQPARKRAKRKGGASMKNTWHGPLVNPHWFNGRRVVYLNVPYAEREACKALGARWNPDKQRWWILADIDPSPFQRWLPDPGAKKAAVAQEEARRHVLRNAERRARWHEIHPDRPWPADRPQ